MLEQPALYWLSHLPRPLLMLLTTLDIHWSATSKHMAIVSFLAVCCFQEAAPAERRGVPFTKQSNHSAEFLRELAFLNHCVHDKNTRNHFYKIKCRNRLFWIHQSWKERRKCCDRRQGGNKTIAWDCVVPGKWGFTWMHLLAVISVVFCWTVLAEGTRTKETQRTSGCYSWECLKATEFFPSSRELLIDLQLRIPSLLPTHPSLSFPGNSVQSPFSCSLPLPGKVI